jgi:hypothetical protein
LWLIYEPHLDSNLFNNLFLTSGHMNVVRFMGDLIVRTLKAPSLAAQVLLNAPRHRINHATVTEMGQSFDHTIKADPNLQVAMLENLCMVAESFNDALTPDAYIVHNETLWEGLHTMLLSARVEKTGPVMLTYPFSSLLDKLPDMTSRRDGGKQPSPGLWHQAQAQRSGNLLPLLDMEQSLVALTNPSIDCLTFFKGLPPIAMLRTQLSLMATGNPWIAGRLRSGAKGAVQFWVPEASQATASFAEVHIKGLGADTPLTEAKNVCALLTVKLGLKCIGKEEPLFKVCVIHTGAAQFALLVSMSHVIGDAATFYALYAMLEPSRPVPTIDATRLPAFNPAALLKALGPEVVSGHTLLPNSEPKLLQQMLKMHHATEKKRVQKAMSLLHVNEGWIISQKENLLLNANVAGFEYLSTNDLLSSWFFSQSDADAGMVQIDCRGRIPGIPGPSDFRPGSYISFIMCLKEDFSTPVALRRKVVDKLKYAALSDATPPPPMPTQAVAPKLANVTNWSAFYHHLDLPGCQHIVHYPIVDSEQDSTHANMYVFRPRQGELAVLIFEDASAPFSCTADNGLSPFSSWRRFDSLFLG